MVSKWFRFGFGTVPVAMVTGNKHLAGNRREESMLKEYHSDKLFWPNNNRVAVTLTFDFQGGEDVRPLPNGLIDHEEYTQCEYGPHTGVYRILRILEQEGVKATFLTCGGIAERFPEAVKAIVAGGHEVAGHGYHHEVARDLTREQENDVMRRTVDMIRQRAGNRPIGWRSIRSRTICRFCGSRVAKCWSSCRDSHSVTAAPISIPTTTPAIRRMR
jgi:hypothetical protein